MMKKLFCFILVLLIFSSAYAGSGPGKNAKGMFFAISVGPRFPLGTFGNTSKIGYGINAELSYANNEILPFFIFLRSGFETYPGSQDFYQISNNSNFSTNLIPINFGIRYYLPPLVKSQVLLMPIIEISGSYGLFHTLHQFKIPSNINDFSENKSKFGFSAGIGFSAFLVEVLASYNYFASNQFVSLNMKVRFPIYINY